MSLEKKMIKVDNILHELSENELNYQDKMKKYLKCKSSIQKCKKDIEKYELSLNSSNIEKVKYNSLSLIEKKIENKKDIDNMSIKELLELYHSSKKIIKDLETDLKSLK